MIKNNESEKLCSICSVDNGRECNYNGRLYCAFKEKIKHKQIPLS